MDETLRAMLLQHDCATGCEIPRNDWRVFPYADLQNSVLRIQRVLNEERGLPFERDGNVQDASLHDELSITEMARDPASGERQRYVQVTRICVSFSNFGRLCTIHGNNLGDYPLETIEQVIQNELWTLVPSEALDSPYDGLNEALRKHGITWFTRFFSYL
ncbi:MAG: hypothetical protein H6718_07910 [Polyangiaceae bacterium]|nr:hypothetical protein [Polyangiaceae bacterium]